MGDTYEEPDQLAQCEAEIERLRADLLTARGEAEDMSGEIERLRAYVAEVGRPVGAHSYE